MPLPNLSIPYPREAYVVFSGRASLWWLRLLKPGFRHCFVIVRMQSGAILLDPLAQQTRIEYLNRDAFVLELRRLESEGLIVHRTAVRLAPVRPSPWRPYSCVELVKRVLGIQLPGIWTPWQLYRYLQWRKEPFPMLHLRSDIFGFSLE